MTRRTDSLAQPSSRLAQTALGDPDENLRSGFLQALPQALQSDPRIDQHRDHAGLEERERQGEEIEPRADHDRGPGPRRDSGGAQAQSDQVAVLVELAVGQVAVADPSSAVPALRNHHRELIGMPAGHRVQVPGDVLGRFQSRRQARGLRVHDGRHAAIHGKRPAGESPVRLTPWSIIPLTIRNRPRSSSRAGSRSRHPPN